MTDEQAERLIKVAERAADWIQVGALALAGIPGVLMAGVWFWVALGS